MKIDTRELAPDLWADVENLFGANGACGGCWCMSWRVQKGQRWEQIKGSTAKRSFKKGILDRSIRGVIAYADSQPVGWCTFGPRIEFPRLDRAPSFKCADAQNVWSIPCFFVKRGFRGIGVSKALLTAALRAMKKQGCKTAEGYPSKPGKDGQYIAAFSWTGTQSLFSKIGFRVVGNKDGGKQRVRLSL